MCEGLFVEGTTTVTGEGLAEIVFWSTDYQGTTPRAAMFQKRGDIFHGIAFAVFNS